jgi:integrase
MGVRIPSSALGRSWVLSFGLYGTKKGEPNMDDLYKREAKILSTKKALTEMCPSCFRIVERFEHTLKLNNYSVGRIEKYWIFLKTIHKTMGTCFDKADRSSIENLVIAIGSNEKWSENTKHDFKTITKFFYRWLLTGNNEGDYPEIVKWVKTKVKKNNTKTPDQILTKEEVDLMASNTNSVRDKALVLILYESGCRVSELLGMRIKDIAFDQHGCHILVSGKTGWRRVRIIDHSKDSLTWLDTHPFKSNNESFVWINSENPSPNTRLVPETVNKIVKNLSKKCNIPKPVHPHAFRHARATFLAKRLPEAVMKQMFGWTNDSKMASVYYHLSGKDVDEALLKLHGIKTENLKEEKVGIRLCQKCGENNSILSHFCKKCNFPLDLKFMLELDDKEKSLDQFIKDFLVYYAGLDKNFKRAFKTFVKENNYENLFKVQN